MQIVRELSTRTSPVHTMKTQRSECESCELLLKKVNQARLHALLATTWAQLQKAQTRTQVQELASTHLEEAFKELESHWREVHRMSC